MKNKIEGNQTEINNKVLENLLCGNNVYASQIKGTDFASDPLAQLISCALTDSNAQNTLSQIKTKVQTSQGNLDINNIDAILSEFLSKKIEVWLSNFEKNISKYANYLKKKFQEDPSLFVNTQNNTQQPNQHARAQLQPSDSWLEYQWINWVRDTIPDNFLSEIKLELDRIKQNQSFKAKKLTTLGQKCSKETALIFGQENNPFSPHKNLKKDEI